MSERRPSRTIGARRLVAVGSVLVAAALLAGCSSTVQSGDSASTLPPVGGAPAEPEGPDAGPNTGGSTPPEADATTTSTDPDGELTDPNRPVEPSDTTAPSADADPLESDGGLDTESDADSGPVLDVYAPDCVVQVAAGESLSLIADRFDDDTVTPASIRAENDIVGDVIHPGQLLDVCVDNGLNDVTGEERREPNAALLAASTRAAVEVQQAHLNMLFDGLGIPPLLVDGDSGPVTRQRLCAARVALGLPITRDDMAPGSEDEEILLAATELPMPFTTALLSERWILIDQTCQIMFVGESTERLVHVFPTSTGEEGHRTRSQDRTPAFRFNPALDNGGWHNSTTFPAAEDNPLNGNMYKPLYFDRGQAIHGANNVPRSPASKGCARLSVEHMDLLVGWLGLDDVTGVTTNRGRINVTVNVQGTYD